MTLDLTTYGVQSSGYVKMRMDEIVGDVFDRLEQQWQVSLDRNPNSSLIAGLVYILAERISALYEVGEGVYNAMYPSSASGVSLDNAVSFIGITRLDAAYTTAWQTFFGAEGAIVPLGTQVQNTATGDAYQTTSALEITAAACNTITLTPSSVANSTQYSVTIDGNQFSYTSSSAATITEIATNLGAQVSKYGIPTVVNGASITLTETVETVHNIAFSANLSATVIGSPCTITAVTEGPLEADAGTLTDLASTLSKVTGTTNTAAATSGRYAENDAELKVRHATGPFVLGAATQNAIYSNLVDCPGVTSCRVLVNSTHAQDANNIPQNSVAAIVTGGSDANVAAALFGVVAGGIPTYGSTAVVLNDNQGTPVTVSFSRPIAVYAWVIVTVAFYTEETFPVNGDALIEASVVQTGNALTPGADIITQRFLGPIFAAVSGLATISVSVAVTTDPTAAPDSSAYSTGNVAVSAFNQAVFDTSRVTVNA